MKDAVFDLIFNSRSEQLETCKEYIGVVSIDELKQFWRHIQTTKDHLMVAASKNGKVAMLGQMCKQKNGKFVLKVELSISIKNGVFSGYNYWHITKEEAAERFLQLSKALSAG